MCILANPNAVPPAARTVLVVDDVADARDMLARLLRLDGYKPVTAEDGEGALAAVAMEHPDLVLLDMTMPDMDGLDVLRRLRENPDNRALPVVLFTAVNDPHLVAESRRLGAADYLVKGSMPACDLMDRIAQYLAAV